MFSSVRRRERTIKGDYLLSRICFGWKAQGVLMRERRGLSFTKPISSLNNIILKDKEGARFMKPC